LTEILVRRARRNEAKTIADLLSRCQRFTYGELFSDDYIERLIEKYYNVERVKQEVTTVDNKWHGYFVAEQHGNIVGVIGGGMIDKTNGEIYVFYVDPDRRGAGLGSRLLSFYTKLQKHVYGAEQQWVSVAKGNKYGIPFYEAKGFTYVREEISYGATEEDEDVSLVYSRRI
jgi:ribosomal protein S18 acetylase RimI-like enzyme